MGDTTIKETEQVNKQTTTTTPDNLWQLVKEDFDEKLPRRTSVLVKADDFDLPFAYPAEFGCIGWNFDNREATTYDEAPVFSMKFGDYSFPDLTGQQLARNTFYFNKMESYPSLIKREVHFSNIGLEIDERFAQNPRGGFIWDLLINNLNHPSRPFRKKLFTLVTLDAGQGKIGFNAREKVFEIQSGDKKFFLATTCDHFGCYETFDDSLSAVKKVQLSDRGGKGKYLVLEFDIDLKNHLDTTHVKFGISFQSASQALAGLKDKNFEEKIQNKWNAWFATLPTKKFESDRDRKAFYKCWQVVRHNYYKHPKWGKTVLEALPVYRGYWQWALPAMEWHSRFNPEIGMSFVKKMLDVFLKYQSDNGYVAHAIYLSEKVPGESWANKKDQIVQTPHVPWVALRYYNQTEDVKSLKAWYPKLKKYYDYLCDSRDKKFFDLHLWGIISSFDTGLDTTSVFSRVTHGDENGVKENFCYPAIFAAERCRYEQAMARISEIIGNGEEEYWYGEFEQSLQAMDMVLWDDKRKWYGVLHEDRTLDTRVGVDGLFPFAYGLVDKAHARQAKDNFKKLIDTYGVRTVAQGEPGCYEDIYWRGAVWPKPCSLGMNIARLYYPDLRKKVKDGLVNFLLRHPSVWECMNASTGKIGRGDMGLMATPMISSNVGAGEAMGALMIYYGEDMFSLYE
jgi:hypothetical protein